MSQLPSSPVCRIVPPYLLEALAARARPDVAQQAAQALAHDEALRASRLQRGATTRSAAPVPPASAGQPGLHRTISDAHGTEDLPGTEVRAEGGPATGDAATDEAYDGLGSTWELYDTAFARDSLDGHGMPLLGTVHYGQRYDNAFWDGSQMVFGDGDGTTFNRFTIAVDVIGHELTHGVTQLTAGLDYQDQSGALNESISDAFGSMVKQRQLGQDVEAADWLIGAGLFTDAVKGVALRSLKAPGTAYDDPVLGKDPQPATMAGYVHTTDDNGGVHLNSGIPNHAFYLAATAIGGHSWEGAGLVWYDVLTGDAIRPDCDFATFAGLTVAAAASRFGDGSTAHTAVQDAWRSVGVAAGAAVPGAPSSTAPAPSSSAPPGPGTGRVPDPGAQLVVGRSGGLAGLSQQRELSLGELPRDDAEAWAALLGGRRLHELAEEPAPARPDAFVYRVMCDDAGVDLQLAEPALPSDVRDLITRTLAGPGEW